MNTYLDKISSGVSFFDICFDDNYGWFCDAYTNTLYKFNLSTRLIMVEAIIPTKRGEPFFQYGFIAKWKTLLILAPRSAKDILVYDILEKTFSSIKLEMGRTQDRDKYNLFSGIQIYNNYAFLIPGRFSAIVRLDLNTFEVKYFDSCIKNLKKSIKKYDDKKVLFARCNCVSEDKIILPCWQGNFIMEFKFGTGEFKLIEFPEICGELSGGYVQNQELFFATKNDNFLFKSDLSGNVLEQIEIKIEAEKGISFLTNFGSKAIVIPVFGRKIIQWNWDTKQSTEIMQLSDTKKKNSYAGQFFGEVDILSSVKDEKENLWIYSIWGNEILKLDMNTGQAEKIAAILSENCAKKKLISYLKNTKSMWGEDDSVSISDFCDDLWKVDDNIEDNIEVTNAQRITAGENICEVIFG
ncbi:hypothetical protein D5274_03675 [bacterium 1XD42-94]|nr:hypothetical protein [bacterium 1XD42-76]NBK04278.1 hypothetical protein [bacterium 1XD42-94]